MAKHSDGCSIFGHDKKLTNGFLYECVQTQLFTANNLKTYTKFK